MKINFKDPQTVIGLTFVIAGIVLLLNFIGIINLETIFS